MDKQKGQQNINTPPAKCWATEQKKNNVNRETQVLKAIINQTRSIGNEFLVINIKAEQGPGQSRLCAVVQGCTRRFSPCRTKSTSTINRENPEYNPATQSRNGNENWTNNNNNIEEVEKRIAAGLYFCLFIHTLTRGTHHVVVVEPLLLTGKNVNKKYGFNFTPVRVWFRAECGPGFAATVSDD